MAPAPVSLPFSLHRLRGDYPALAGCLRGVERAAATDAPILVLGEPGSGRSSLARALHAASGHAGGPLVEVDPGALPSALFESELFGYRAGAFTGAAGDAEGRVARAAGGSLVLDHIEELPLASQPKLLRLLAERRYAPLGGDETDTSARFLAIGPDDLADWVTRGAFRADLYYRLEVVAFHLPPLRDRRADLPVLFADLMRDLAERFGRPALALSPAAAEWMLAHSWPGNLRQLRNVLERSLILGAAAPDGVQTLDPPPLADPSWPPGTAEPAPRPLLEVEREQIRRALAYSRGHQGQAAQLLGISRKALWEKRRRYGIP